MIKFYAYYNHGGYKDFFLGSSEDIVNSRYYLPMLPVYETDESMKEKVEEWKALPPIVCLSNQTVQDNYPSEARVLMSHAGYKLQYRIIGAVDVLALRDIIGNKDSYGRFCPFVMMFVADTELDRDNLKKITHYLWENIKESEAFFCSLFVNDFQVNGLRFDIQRLNDHLNDIISSHEGTLEKNVYNKRIPLFIIPDGVTFKNAREEQQISKDDVALAYDESRSKYYRYEPQTVYGPTGTFPVYDYQSQDKPEETKEPEGRHSSLRNSLGLAKEEDFQRLLESHRKLQEEVKMLENRINELENKLL